MSGFDSNPFADPEASNPFADPSVTRMTHNVTNTTTRGLEDYNPFADDGRKADTHPPPNYKSATSAAGQPAVMWPVEEHPPPPPAYTPTAQERISTEELQRRQEELERKAAELQRREEELLGAPFAAKSNNWPPLPAKCPVQPCFYQDITVDIPLEFQKIVRTMYYLWMFDACVMFLNVLGGLALFIGLGDGATFGLSLVYFVVFTPFAYICWFRPIYKAFRSDSSFNFFVFFFVFFFNCIVKGLFAIGIGSMGTCGFLVGLSTLRAYSTVTNYAVGGIVLIIGFLFAVDSLLGAIMLLKIHKIYRSTGASFAKAQQEFTTGVMRNEHVQHAAANAASDAVRHSMTGNRY